MLLFPLITSMVNPTIIAKNVAVSMYRKKSLQNYADVFFIVYLFWAFLLCWINGLGYPKNFASFNWQIMLGIEGDANYSASAIGMISIVLHLTNKIKLRSLLIINTVAFILLFSRTAFITIVIYVVGNYLFYRFRRNFIFKMNILLLILIAFIPVFILSVPKDLGLILNAFTSGRFGYWSYLVSGEALYANINYYQGKQAHNALFQMIGYFGIWGGVSLFTLLNLIFMKVLNKTYWIYSFASILLIQMFLNSFTSMYFLIWIIGGLRDGKYRMFRIR